MVEFNGPKQLIF